MINRFGLVFFLIENRPNTNVRDRRKRKEENRFSLFSTEQIRHEKENKTRKQFESFFALIKFVVFDSRLRKDKKTFFLIKTIFFFDKREMKQRQQRRFDAILLFFKYFWQIHRSAEKIFVVFLRSNETRVAFSSLFFHRSNSIFNKTNLNVSSKSIDRRATTLNIFPIRRSDLSSFVSLENNQFSLWSKKTLDLFVGLIIRFSRTENLCFRKNKNKSLDQRDFLFVPRSIWEQENIHIDQTEILVLMKNN